MESIIIGTERVYGTKIKGETTPSDFWDYCVHNRIPYIIVRHQIKYTFISYDLLTIDKGLTFNSEHDFSDVWMQVYNDYVLKSLQPKNKISYTGSGLYREILILKKDQTEIISLLFRKIEDHIKQHGKIDLKIKKQYELIAENNRLAEDRDKYLEMINKNK